MDEPQKAHSKATIISMAVTSMGLAALLHEGVGHGVTAWLRGDMVTQLTSNHLSDLKPDRLVEAGGTIVNVLTGTIALAACYHARPNLRFFLWFFAAVSLLDGADSLCFRESEEWATGPQSSRASRTRPPCVPPWRPLARSSIFSV